MDSASGCFKNKRDLEMDFFQDPKSWQILGGIFGALASFGAFLKWIWPLVRQGYRNIMEHSKIQGQLHDLDHKIENLLLETKPNGGSSLRDALARIEHNVELQNERLRAMLVDSEEMCFEADASGRVIWANRTILRKVGKTPVEILGQGWVNIIAPVNRDKVVDKWLEAIEHEREFDMEVIWRNSDHEEFPVHVRSYRMVSAKGKTMGYFGTVKLL